MSVIGREAIRAAQDLPEETIYVSEWGGEVILRGLTGRQRDEYEHSLLTFDKKGNVEQVNTRRSRVRLVALCMVDEDRMPLYNAAEEGDLAELESKSSLVINQLYEIASRLSGLGGDAIEDAEKN